MIQAQIVLMARSPVPGLCKTRLSPALTPAQAALVAESLLIDVIDAIEKTSAARRVIALDGAVGAWLPVGWDVIPQRGQGLAERLAAAAADAFDSRPIPLLILVSDTPLLEASLLEQPLTRLMDPHNDAVLGLAEDGGWWALGLKIPQPAVFSGVPMSTDSTGAHQRDALTGLGLRVEMLSTGRDIDTFDDLLRAAPLLDPKTSLAGLLQDLLP